MQEIGKPTKTAITDHEQFNDERDNMPEETLANGEKIATLLGKVAMGLASLHLPETTANLWNNNPAALTSLVATLVKPPTFMQVISERLHKCCGLGVLINSWLGRQFNVFAIDTIIEKEQGGFILHPYTTIVVTHLSEIYTYLLDNEQLTRVILVAETDPQVSDPDGKGVVLSTLHETLEWVGKYQLDKYTSELNQRMATLANLKKSRTT